jgi:DNA polymerase III alpha subunit
MIAPRPRSPGKAPGFVHLHVHSGWSLEGGASQVEELAARASALGYRALALTDTNGAYALPAFETCCAAVDLKPIVGAELSERVSVPGERASAGVLVADAAGHRGLCRLVTRRRLDERFTLLDDLPAEAEGLVVFTSSPELLRAWAEALPRGDLYGEVVAHEEPARREALLCAARETGRPVVGTHRVFFDHPKKHDLHRLRLAISHLKLLHEVVPGATGRDGHPLDLVPASAALLPPAEALRAFRRLPEAARATLEIAERIDFAFERPKKPRLPTLDAKALGLGHAPASEAERAEAAYDRLAALCLEGLKSRYPRLRPAVLARLERELKVIQDRGFSDYFLIVHGLALFARARGIPAVGRGSAANSLVAYALGITSVDPLRHDLPFERFLSPARADCPDIDLDLDWRGRDAVIRHAYEAYGDDRVAMISTHVTFRRRSALRETAKTLGVPLGDPERFEEGREAPSAERAGEVRPLARTLVGLPRHLSIHVGGIVIGDGPLMDSVPLERAAKGLVVTQYDMHGVERTGLLLIDLLCKLELVVVF